MVGITSKFEKNYIVARAYFYIGVKRQQIPFYRLSDQMMFILYAVTERKFYQCFDIGIELLDAFRVARRVNSAMHTSRLRD